MMRRLKRVVYPAVAMAFSHATLVEGRLKGSGEPFRFLFVDNTPFGEYVNGRIFEQPPAVLMKRRIPILRLRHLLARRPALCDLCVAVLPRAYERIFLGLYDYRTTDGIRQVIDTSGTWEDVRATFGKKKRQISNGFEEKSGLAHRMSRDPADFDFFYHRMFVPHIRRRYGDLASIDPYREMKAFFERGLLVFVTRGDAPVAGALCLVEDGMLRFRRTGVLDGDEAHVEGGAQTALYYFQLRYAQATGLRAVDTMLSAPFLNDGVFRHKREWGAAVMPDEEAATWVYLFHAGPSGTSARFFEANPMVAYGARGLEGVVGLPEPSVGLDRAVDDLLRRHETRGLQGFRVVTPTTVLER